MYAYFQGILADKSEEGIVVECGGIGYNILVGGSVLDHLPACGSEVKIYTYTAVKEDSISLYGFLTKEDVRLFRLLISVSGIGPKGAQSILSGMNPEELRFAILSEDVNAIAKTPGIGKKTAQKLVIELKDKLHIEGDASLPAENAAVAAAGLSDARSEAVQALVALGYQSAEALAAVKQSGLSEDADVEAILKDALRRMAFL